MGELYAMKGQSRINSVPFSCIFENLWLSTLGSFFFFFLWLITDHCEHWEQAKKLSLKEIDRDYMLMLMSLSVTVFWRKKVPDCLLQDNMWHSWVSGKFLCCWLVPSLGSKWLSSSNQNCAGELWEVVYWSVYWSCALHKFSILIELFVIDEYVLTSVCLVSQSQN